MTGAHGAPGAGILPRGLRLVVALAVAGTLGACGDGGGAGGRRAPSEARDAPQQPAARVRARTEATFGRAAQLMPGDGAGSGVLSDLLPLLLVEGRLRGSFGVAAPAGDGTAGLRAGAPTVYAGRSRAWIGRRPHDQVHYHWWFRRPCEERFRSQGVRITLRADGHPLVWEVQRDASGLRVLYVAESLEARARERFGPPLPGRRFAVERPVRERPDVVVARLLADGPMPMGPWVYLRAPAGDVTTLLCRCMASQAGGPLARTDYRVRAWEHPPGLPEPFRDEDPADPPGRRLEGRLRWP